MNIHNQFKSTIEGRKNDNLNDICRCLLVVFLFRLEIFLGCSFFFGSSCVWSFIEGDNRFYKLRRLKKMQ